MTINNENINKSIGTVVLCAGGTGGHIFPAEALATKLITKGYRIILLTDKRGTAFGIADNDIQVVRINGAAVTGRKVIRKIYSLLMLAIGVCQSILFLFKIKPKAVVGFGGFASIPGCVAAWILGFPLILHEQNAVLGRANRILAKKASIVITSFRKVLKVPKGVKTLHIGMPVRDAITKMADAPYPEITAEGPIRLLVMGGSQGARILSNVVPTAITLLPTEIKQRLIICQQCRTEDLDAVALIYKKNKIHAELKSFFNDIPNKMANAHLIITRSGASSMAEIFAIGRPAILVPLSIATDNHQYFNALALTESGGGWLMLNDDFTYEALAEKLKSLFENTKMLQNAASCALLKDTDKIADKIADVVIDIIKKSSNK